MRRAPIGPSRIGSPGCAGAISRALPSTAFRAGAARPGASRSAPARRGALLPVAAPGPVPAGLLDELGLAHARGAPGAGRWPVCPRIVGARRSAGGHLARSRRGAAGTGPRRRSKRPPSAPTGPLPRSTAPFSPTALCSRSRPAPSSSGRSKSFTSPPAAAPLHTRSLVTLGAGSRAQLARNLPRRGPLLAQRCGRVAARRRCRARSCGAGRRGGRRGAFRRCRRAARPGAHGSTISRCCSAAAPCGMR